MSEGWQLEEATEGFAFAAWKHDGLSWYTARVKYDGCLEFARYFNTPREHQEESAPDPQDYDSIHLCDLDEEIARLTLLRDLMRAHFGADWGK